MCFAQNIAIAFGAICVLGNILSYFGPFKYNLQSSLSLLDYAQNIAIAFGVNQL
jgi:hypothetical protein